MPRTVRQHHRTAMVTVWDLTPPMVTISGMQRSDFPTVAV
jgi:hypothetical protein